MKLILTHLPFLSLFLLVFVTLLVAGAPYTPTDQINLNCGSSGQEVLINQTWIGDIKTKFSPVEVGGASVTINAPPSSNAAEKVPFKTARLSLSEFTYRIPVSPGPKFIRLYFFPAAYDSHYERSNSLFSVKLDGSFNFTLLDDFNASVQADADDFETMIREFTVNVEAESRRTLLNITFAASKGGGGTSYAFINGIEITSMPDFLYYTKPRGNLAPKMILGVDTYSIGNNTAMEKLYRLNVGGGGLISPEEDTGMYRTWDNTDFLYLDRPSINYSFEYEPPNDKVRIKFSQNFPDYVAPEKVYKTARTMGVNKTIDFNLTWNFLVHPKFNYLVRLHFCEIDPIITEVGDRRFQIYIANETAEEGADIFLLSGGFGVPWYQDYVVFVPNAKASFVNLTIALHAGEAELTTYTEVILNGMEIFKLSDADGNLAGPNPDPPPEDKQNVNVKQLPESHKKSKKKVFPMLAIVAGVVSAFLVVCVVGFLLCMHGRKKPNEGYVNSTKASKWGPFSFSTTTKSTKSRGSSLPSDLCRHFSLSEIISATRNFNPNFIIGVGGFGNVYKGNLDDGGATIPVAIKRLKPESSQGAVEFKTEIDMLSQLRHLHLVSLIGYCTDNDEMILVYEYMENGTLRDHLYNTRNNNAPPIAWEQRLRICIGAARGLHYLHTGVKRMIIHRDVKTTNILLDEKWVPKVSDFGLSKMGTATMSKTHISTKVKGSFGYLDPEYYRRQQLTEKSDVYSFGVILCEVLCARPALIRTVEKKQMSLAEWTKTNNRNGTIWQIIDPNLRGKIAATCLNKFIKLALSCMNDNGNDRPSMSDVVWGLELALQLQESAEVFSDDKDEDEVAFMKGVDEGMSSSWEYTSSDQKNNRTTKTTSSSEDLSITKESIGGMSSTIFSEIKDPTVR